MLPGPSLDPPTLLFSTALVSAMMSAFAYSTARAMPEQRRCLQEWARANLAAGIAFLLYFLRGHIPFAISFLFANLAVLLVPILMLRALARLVGHTANPTLSGLVMVVGVLGVVPGTLAPELSVLGAVSVSAGIAAMSGALAWLMWTHPLARTLPAARFTAVVGALSVLTFCWRTVNSAALWMHGTQPDISTSATSHKVSLLIGGAFIVAGSIAFLTMVHELRRRQANDRARRDGLTGVLNRSAFFEAARHRLAHEPTGRFAVAMIDVDHFKRINDGHGHAAGDVAIAHLAQLVADSSRQSDLVGRYGGEEFVVMLDGADAEVAQAFGQRLLEAVRAAPVHLPNGVTLHCTVSVGVAEGLHATGQPDLDLEQSLARADAALYVAKAMGRDQVQGDAPGDGRDTRAARPPQLA
jgi:diguanylate cyclase (GGDEF)-like protein